MSKIIEKNRYMTLDGDIIGGPGWKNICLSYAFMAATLAVGLSFYKSNTLEEVKKNSGISLLGLITSSTLRKYIIYRESLYSSRGINFKTQCLDTSPDGNINRTTLDLSRQYTLHVSIHATYASAFAIGIPTIFNTAVVPIVKIVPPFNLLETVLFASPLIAEGIQCAGRAYKTYHHRWVVIDRTKMEDKQPLQTILIPA